jgi:hypothetical protein
MKLAFSRIQISPLFYFFSLYSGMPVSTSRIFPPAVIRCPVNRVLLRTFSVLVHVNGGNLTNQYGQHSAVVWSFLFGTPGVWSLGQRKWTVGQTKPKERIQPPRSHMQVPRPFKTQ